MRNNRRKVGAGFSIPELLVAIALFVTAFSYLLECIGSATHATYQAQQQHVGQDLAERIQETQRSKAFDSIISIPSTNTTVMYINAGNQVAGIFTYSVTVTDENVASLGPLLPPPGAPRERRRPG